MFSDLLSSMDFLQNNPYVMEPYVLVVCASQALKKCERHC